MGQVNYEIKHTNIYLQRTFRVFNFLWVAMTDKHFSTKIWNSKNRYKNFPKLWYTVIAFATAFCLIYFFPSFGRRALWLAKLPSEQWPCNLGPGPDGRSSGHALRLAGPASQQTLNLNTLYRDHNHPIFFLTDMLVSYHVLCLF